MTTDTNEGGITGIRTAGVPVTDQDQDLRELGVDVGELLRWDGVPPIFALRNPDGNGLTVTRG